MRIVRAHAKMADHAAGLQLLGVLHHRAFKDRAEILLAVHIVDHAHVDVVGLEALQQVGKGPLCLFNVPGTGVLPVLEYRTQMALDDKFFPPALQSDSQVAAGGCLGHEDVDVVDAALLRGIHDRGTLLGGQAVEPFAAQTDFAYLQAGAAQRSVLHR